MSKRWSNTEEKLSALTSLEAGELGGAILFRKGKSNYVFSDEGHMTIIGGSGTGKSRRLTFGQVRALIMKQESFIAIDPKGELAKNTMCYCKDTYNIKIFNCNKPGNSHRWNPLQQTWELWHRGEYSAAQEKAREFVKDFCGNYKTNDHFWKESLINLITGMVYVLIKLPDKNQCNIGTIYRLLNEDRESIKNNDSQAGIVSGGKLQDLVDSLKDDDPAKKMLAGYLSGAMATRSSVLTTVTNKLTDWCATEEISNLTSGDDFDVVNLDVNNKPLAVYVIIPDGKKVYSEIAAMLVSQLTTHFKELADRKYNGTLPNRLNVILEELGNIGDSISELPELMSAARSRNIRITNVIQSSSQLDALYGPNNAETIRSNTNVWVMFRNSNLNTLYEFSRRCGDREIRVGDMVKTQPLIESTQLGEMVIGQCLIIINNGIKYIEQLPDYDNMFDCSDRFEVPIPKTIVDKKAENLKLSDIKNHIISGKRPKTAASFFRSEEFLGGNAND